MRDQAGNSRKNFLSESIAVGESSFSSSTAEFANFIFGCNSNVGIREERLQFLCMEGLVGKTFSLRWIIL